LGLKEGVALAAADEAASGGKTPPAAAGAKAASTTPTSTTPLAFTALVPVPQLPKGLELQYADEQLATSKGAAADPARLAKARPYVRVESPGACCALCASVPRCTSFTHGAVVLGPAAGGADGVGEPVRSSCELWAEGPAAKAQAAAAAASSGPANGESATRPAVTAQQLQSVPAPAWVTSGRVPRAAEGGSIKRNMGEGEAAAAGARASGGDDRDGSASIVLHAKPKLTPVGGGLYGGAFDTHLGDYQGTAVKVATADAGPTPTPCARASDAVKAGGSGTEALFNALHAGVAGLPSAYEQVMTEEEYKQAAEDLLGPKYASQKAITERWWGDVGGGAPSPAAAERPKAPVLAAAPAAAAKNASVTATATAAPPRRRLAQQKQKKKQAAAAPRDPCGASLALMTSTWLAGGTAISTAGGDASTGGGTPSGTVRACCELCAATGGCQYWTFSTPLATCWLRSGSAAALASAGAAASQPSGGGGPLASVPCRYSISGAMEGAPSPGICPATLVCRGSPTEALPDGAASCCPAAGWVCGAAGVCCPPGSAPCGQQCACASGTTCNGTGPDAQCVAVQTAAAAIAPPLTTTTQFQSQQQPPAQQQQFVQAQQPGAQSQLGQFQGQQQMQQQMQPGGSANTGGGANLSFGPGGGQGIPTYSADTPRFGYYGRGVTDGAALITDPSDPQACRQRPAEGAAALRFGRFVALNSGGALNRNAPVAQATAVDCCLACGGIGNCDAFSWDGSSLACYFWTNKINGIAQQRLETTMQGAVTGDMIRALTFRADGTPVPRLDDACRAPCGPSDGSAGVALCCQQGRETCLAPTGVGVGGDRFACCNNASVCGRRCGCDPGSICVAGETCCPGERVCGSSCCPQGQACNANGACGAPQNNNGGGLVVVNPQPYGWNWNRGGWGWGDNGGWAGNVNVVVPLPVSRIGVGGGNVFEG
jgi:hypothetical protein